eukprot:IDg4504t1
MHVKRNLVWCARCCARRECLAHRGREGWAPPLRSRRSDGEGCGYREGDARAGKVDWG